MAIPALSAVSTPAELLDPQRFDALVLVSPAPRCGLEPVDTAAAVAAAVDGRVGKDVMLVPADGLPGGRLLLAPTGPLSRDQDDVRRFADAARAGVVRARQAGARAPALLLSEVPGAWRPATQVALLGALGGLWEPLEAREALGADVVEPVELVGFVGSADEAKLVQALEEGRRLARDLGGTEAERMRPEAFAGYCRLAFEDTGVEVQINEDLNHLRASYPLLMAVARASVPIKRHQPKVVRLVLEPEGEVQRTLFLVGKGVTYDTGGHDLKTGGHMGGMSRDKGGAASVAGLVRALAELRVPGLRVVAELGVVRNSIGPEGFVTDEIIRSHAGVRVRIGNTDAEGRLVMADLLSHLREEAIDATEPHLFTVATLTGHAALAVGEYSVAMDNGPARLQGAAAAIAHAGEAWGDPFEVSRLRREDWDFVKARSSAEDVVSSNDKPSAATPRGHQFPMAFLAIASGLSQHGVDAPRPLPYTHVDLAGSFCEGMDWRDGRPTAAAVVALATWVAGL